MVRLCFYALETDFKLYLLFNLLILPRSYMDTEQYEEAVRDYEKVYQTEKTKGVCSSWIC